jgi:hypothetical protein
MFEAFLFDVAACAATYTLPARKAVAIAHVRARLACGDDNDVDNNGGGSGGSELTSSSTSSSAPKVNAPLATKVLSLVSGGVDSTVCTALVKAALPASCQVGSITLCQHFFF